ncbi:hypothetical protein DFS33DRAFT_1376955 [Desarmillaria ectypa]|nr:hypothetical protein DFS33DRAFT_1376955 [Desarmillaria ectypa]
MVEQFHLSQNVDEVKECLDCGPASSGSSSSLTTDSASQQCVINSGRLIGVIIGVVGLVLISAIATFLRRRRTSMANYPLAQLPAPVPWPSAQFSPAPPPPVYVPMSFYQQQVVQSDNSLPSPAPAQSNNQFRVVFPPTSPEAQRTTSHALADGPYNSHAVDHRSHQQPVVRLDNAFPSPAPPVQSNNQFHRYPPTENVSPPASSEARRTSSQVPSDDPYNSHAVTHRPHQQSVVQPDNVFPTALQSNNPFRRYPLTETVSPLVSPEAPPVSSDAPRTTTQADDPYDSYAVAHRQQAAVLAKYSRTSNNNQLSESAASSVELQPPPYTR